MNCITLIFSKDRTLQLDATLRSFFLHCQDAASSEVRILFTTTTPLHAEQYRQLEKEYQRYTFLQFVREKDFRSDVIALLAPFEQVLFLTDDNIFVQDFRLSEVIESLQKHTDALGFSIRLGRNTTYCYPLSKAQQVPDLESIGTGIFKYNWTIAEYDFGYPLEVSSSLYRVEDILPFIAQLPFRNPNTLEALMAERSAFFREKMPFLLCFEQSVTFCAPINMVQTMWVNRASNKIEYSSENLAKLFDDGLKIDISAYNNFIPNACHQEVELKLVEPAKTDKEQQPMVSVIIPCYNQACYLPEVVESVVSQTYHDWECIIVNDGSPDNTSEVARDLIKKYPTKKIILLEKENGGLADARNFGIKKSKGKYILPLDADDKIHPEMLHKTVDLLEKYPGIAIAYTDTIRFGKVNNTYQTGEYDLNTLCLVNILNYCSLYRREAWESAGGYNTNMVLGYEDWDFWIACGEKGFYGKRIPEPLFMYRIKDESMLTNAYRHDEKLKAQIVLNHPTLYDQQTMDWAKNVISFSKVKTGIPTQKKDSSEKILFAVHNFPTKNMAGTELYAYCLAQEFRRRGYNVSLVYPEFDRNRPQSVVSEYSYEDLSVAQINLHPSSDLIHQFKNEQAAAAFRNYISEHNIKLVHFQHLLGFSASSIEVCAQMGIPVILTLHDEWLLCEQFFYLQADGSFCKGPETVEKCVYCFVARHPELSSSQYIPILFQVFTMRRQYLQNALSWIDTLIVPSNFLQEELKMHGFTHPNTLHVPLGIYPFKPLHRGLQEGRVQFTYLGHIHPLKGFDIVIHAFNLLNIEKVELNIYGDVKDHHYYNQVMGMSLKRQIVKYHGPYKPEDLPGILAKTDIAIIPSRSENYPFVVRECLHAKVPVIASRVGGIPEIIKDGENGLLFEPGNYHDLANKLLFCIQNPKTVDRFRRNIQPVRSITEDAEQLESIYREILERKLNKCSKVLKRTSNTIANQIIPQSAKDPYFFEDYVRVYPDEMVFDIYGNKRQPTKNDINNFLNHCKFYTFASQFVQDKCVADVGCGSGYGCEIVKKAGASKVHGADLSEHAINFAKSRYSDFAEFTIQSITALKEYPDNYFDVTISSEVLEHIKGYGMEEKAIKELKRITRDDGLIIIGTPNSELLGDHGFSFDEINNLFHKNFSQYCIFENALVPFGHNKLLWEKRLSEDKVGVIISQYINLSETVLPDGITPEIKKGIEPGRFKFANYDIDTTLLHNTYSWIILAIIEK